MFLTLLQEGWHFLFGWAGLDILVGAAATAIAILEPKQLDAITDLRKWAIVVAVIAFSCTGLIAHGYKNGLDEKQSEWDVAKAATVERTEKVRDDAVRTVTRKHSRWVRHGKADPDLRD